MTTEPIHAVVPFKLGKLVLPPHAKLQHPATVSATISDIMARDEAVAGFHRKMVHLTICIRYELALAVAADKKAFAAYARDKRVKALARPPKSPADTLVTLFNATYADPKKASKYFKRIEPLWVKRRPAKEVLSFLQKHGLSDPQTTLSPPQPPSTGDSGSGNVGRNKIEQVAAGQGTAKAAKPSPGINKKDPPGGSILEWPGPARVGQTFRLTVKIFDYSGGAATVGLIALPELLT